MKIGKYTIPEIRKAVVAWVLAAVMLIAAVPSIFGEWLSVEVLGVIATVVAVLTAVGVFLIKNEKIIDAMGRGRPEEGLPPEALLPPEEMPPPSEGATPPATPPTATPTTTPPPPLTARPRIIPPE